VFSPVSSPDRRQVAVTWNRRDGRGLWVIDRMAGQERLVYPTRAGTLRPIGWSADGREIYAVEAKGGVYRGLVLPQGDTMTDARILRIAIGGGPAYPVVTLPFEEIGSVSMSGDGRRFVCTVYASESDVWIVDLPDEPREEL
jgi:Tol biopolymer transport system component